MSRWKWTPIRHVAENVSAGDRSYWNLLKIPDLASGQASAAITEMEQLGVISATGTRVEPTEAFGTWLADLRRREDQPTICPPAGQPQLAVQPALPAAAPPSTRTFVRKRYFRHLSANPRQAGLEMAARIKDLLERQSSGSMLLSAAKRALHGDRRPNAWQEGIRRLVVHRIATVVKGQISLTWTDTIELPDPYRRPEEAKRHREPTEWFEQNRSKMDRGQHTNFDEDWDDESHGEDDLAAQEAWWKQLDGLTPDD